MNIRHQILLLPVLVALIAGGLLAAGMLYIEGTTDRVTRERELGLAEEQLRGALAGTLDEALARAELIAALPPVQAAMAARDDAALEALLAPAWKRLRDETGIEQLQFHLPPATSLIRIHDLTKRGDDLSGVRRTVVDANASGRPVQGLERGKAGLGARGVAVVRAEGRPVGTVEVGLSVGSHFLRTLAARTGYDFEYYDLPAVPGAAGAVTRLATTRSDAPLLSAEQLAALRTGGVLELRQITAGAPHLLRAFAIRDYQGEVAGIFTVAVPTAIYDTVTLTSRRISLLLAGVSVLIAAGLALLLGRRIVGQIAAISRATVDLASGNRDIAIPGTARRDVLGDMARALQVFAANLAETERIAAALRLEEENARKAEAARLAAAAEAAEAQRTTERAAAEAQRRLEQEARAAAEVREAEAQARLHEQVHVVGTLAGALEALSQRDLTFALEEELPGDYDQLRRNFNGAVGQLSHALAAIEAEAAQIDTEVGRILTSSEELGHNTERNAATLEETAAALNQLTVSVQSAADGATAARDLATAARRNAESGVEVVQRAVEAMAEIEGSARAISRITAVIDDIAFQTNLLALNAGVEAARAGESGRGFAVVASEVRALAQRSSEAAKEISVLIDSSNTQVRSGVALVGQTGEALGQITASVRDISERVGEIALSAGEQAGGISEINAAVNQLDHTSQTTAAMFDTATEAARLLAEASAKLVASVHVFTFRHADEARADRLAAE